MSVRFRKFVQGYSDAGDYLVALITFDSEQLVEPVYLNSTHETVVSQDRTFLGLNIDYILPGSQEQQAGQLSLFIPGITQQMIKLLDLHPQRFDVTLEIVMRSTPDEIEVGPFRMRSRSTSIDYATAIAQIECVYDYTLDMPLVTKKLTIGLVPGAFGASED